MYNMVNNIFKEGWKIMVEKLLMEFILFFMSLPVGVVLIIGLFCIIGINLCLKGLVKVNQQDPFKFKK